MIEAQQLTKRYGGTTAVDGISFTIAPGTVTGFLGPNGAGKSTTMRMIVGLDRPTSGTVTVNGTAYDRHRRPLHEVGALLDAKAVHPGRSARSHLRTLAATNGIGRRRVDEVVEMTGLATVADKRVGGFSLGMGQRLGIAAAMLGDPRTLILDEPVNGLDPEGVHWVRQLVRRLAAEEHGLVTDPADPGAWRQIGGAALFMVVAGLFSLGLGTILRSTAGTVASALTVLLVLPGVLGLVRLDWVETLVSYLPAPAASAFINGGSTSPGEALQPGVGLAVVIAYAVVPMAVGAVLLRRRDA